MAKTLAVISCVLGLTMGFNPAYASPTNKRITVSCNGTAPYNIVGVATITLCEATTGDLCSAGTFDCPTGVLENIQCDSGNTVSDTYTITCAPGFKVDAAIISQRFIDYLNSFEVGTGDIPAGTFSLSKGGFVNTLTNSFTGDSFTLKVK